ncbi:hypothetical protein BST92_03390 [Nonlabens arenilitoris]|uniref:GLPGLI family protein n=1 Tax=Nonlabens arenilitoris TaxID=1217969 RepID=A0A2S7U7T5_9FLAO|nr:GLPGLI family protein [Nonlabens arenilitoris]PQJ31025.1 hypothetical protein BST92_03390 [Nonlabens arenilitoris]
MRLILTFILTLVPFLMFCQIQVQYSVNFIFDKNPEFESPRQKAIYQRTVEPFIEIINNSDGILYACENQSYFSIHPNSKDSEISNILARVQIERSSWITNDSVAGNVDRKQMKLVIADYNNEAWNIEPNEKIIAGYKCFKATKNLVFKDSNVSDKTLEVWFTPDVPIKSGLRDATDLPGLILYYNDGQWEFTATGVKVLNECDIKIPELNEISFSESELEARNRLNEKRNRGR